MTGDDRKLIESLPRLTPDPRLDAKAFAREMAEDILREAGKFPEDYEHWAVRMYIERCLVVYIEAHKDRQGR